MTSDVHETFNKVYFRRNLYEHYQKLEAEAEVVYLEPGFEYFKEQIWWKWVPFCPRVVSFYRTPLLCIVLGRLKSSKLRSNINTTRTDVSLAASSVECFDGKRILIELQNAISAESPVIRVEILSEQKASLALSITGYGYGLKIVSSGWSFVSAVLGQMSYLVASLTLDSARTYVMSGVHPLSHIRDDSQLTNHCAVDSSSPEEFSGLIELMASFKFEALRGKVTLSFNTSGSIHCNEVLHVLLAYWSCSVGEILSLAIDGSLWLCLESEDMPFII
ncbi:hypothetical protein Tco_1192756 [Tanacetum coccineum]